MDATTRNPFEPPRTTDLDGDAAAPGPMVLSAEASRELIATAPWVRALARVTMVAIAIQLLGLAGIGAAASAGEAGLVAVSRGATIVVAILVLIVLKKYAAASERLRDGQTAAVAPLLAAQASYLKLAGVLTAIGTGMFMFGLAFAVGSGRLLSWVYR